MEDPIIVRDDLTSVGEYVAPTTPEERAIAEIWARALRIDRVGITDDFFNLDGDSLTAVTAVMEVEERFAVKLSLAAILEEASTVAGMARLVASELGDVDGSVDVGLNTRDQPEPKRLAAPEPRLISTKDVIHTLVFLSLFWVAAIPSQRLWQKVAALIATVQVKLLGAPEDSFCGAAAAAEFNLDPVEFKRRLLVGVYEQFIYTLRSHMPGGWRPKIDLHGTEFIDQALEGGRGVVLWSASSISGVLARGQALSKAGYLPVHLGNATHPYSTSAYGRRVLNPIRSRIEKQYVLGTALISGPDRVHALQKLRDHLHENGIVAIAAVDASEKPLMAPFCGGLIELGLGAPVLAAREGAPILPVFVIPQPGGAFDVLVEPPLQGDARAAEIPRAEQLALDFTARLETHVRRQPEMWAGWLTGGQWRPT